LVFYWYYLSRGDFDVDLVLGIDGGGTSCRAAVAGLNGKIVGRAKSGAANIRTDLTGARANIVEAARLAFVDAGRILELLVRMPGGQRSAVKRFAALVGFDFNMPVKISREGVVPGDRLIGILRQDGTMTVYPVESDALAAFHDKDVGWIDVRWDLHGNTDHLFKAVISMHSANRPGALAQISAAIAACDANISNFVMRALAQDSHEMIFELELRDLTQLTDVLTTLKRTPGLSRVQRASVLQASAISGMEGVFSADTEATQ
jgi:predicted amino acid-binding ACT domain protein